jgi:hypothetical protein
MKAAILHAADSVPVYGDFDDPVPGEGSEIVELVAAGIHQRWPGPGPGLGPGAGPWPRPWLRASTRGWRPGCR